MNNELKYEDVVEIVEIESAKQLFEDLSPFGKYKDVLTGFVFRGECSDKYKLLPSALREVNKEKLYKLADLCIPIENQANWNTWQVRVEYLCLRQFFVNADNNGLAVPGGELIRKNFNDDFAMTEIGFRSTEKWLPDDLHQLAALAQHYGIPTRLLDWSYDYFSAMYFAAEGALDNIGKEDKIVIWALNVRYIQDSQPAIKRIPLVLVKPAYAQNPNINAQKGLLTYWEGEVKPWYENILGVQLVDRTPLDELLYNEVVRLEFKREGCKLLYKFKLPIAEAGKVLEALHQLKYSGATIYPGYDGITRFMNERSRLRNVQKNFK